MWPTNKILMIRPASFGYNTETALTNSFQNIAAVNEAKNAVHEFDQMVLLLQQNEIDVTVVPDTELPEKPDAIFPNNWISMHQRKLCVLYPMLHPNRRIERRSDIIELVCKNQEKLIDLSYLETENIFLEGTGSLVIDHIFNTAYAAISPRTSIKALQIFEEKTGINVISFTAFDRAQQPIYHTNVIMALSPVVVVICLEVIPIMEQEKLLNAFEQSKKEVIEISLQQLENFAGNMLCLKNKQNQSIMLMSNTAYHSLNVVQINAIKKHHKILSLPIPSIEKIGGGSVRCMMAELF
ncbi:MAG TPA: arginine deiminase-related protein [Bacteroidia bacterium]|nr:arginine deiminase-related protein [Bacteroidia bacterium]